MSTPAPLSPTLDPRVLEPLASGFRIGDNVFDKAFTAAQGAMQLVNTTAGALAEAEEAVKLARDPQSERRLRSAAESKLGAARKAIETGMNAVAQRREALENEIDADLGIPAAREQVTNVMRGEGIRAHLRSLSKDDRFAAAREAINAGDVEAVSAILSASPLGSGLDRDTMKLIRMQAEHKFAPGKVVLRANLDKLAGVLERAGSATVERFGSLVGHGDGRDARAQRALKALEGGAA